LNKNKLIIIASAFIFLVSCQKYTLKKEQRLREQGKIQCGWYGKKTIAECRKMYPFNEAAKIILISFPDYENEDMVRTYKGDTSMTTKLSLKIPTTITKPILDTLKIFDRLYSVYEKTELNMRQKDSLSNLSTNFTTNINLKYGIRSIRCYSPRNAIIFYDKNNNPFVNYEICFECHQAESYPNGSRLGNDECDELYDLFKDFFKKNGIHYGIDSMSTDKY
jgi:hypothetical protein